jgi:histidine triad (HIT) family protein
VLPEDYVHVALAVHKIAPVAMRAFNADGLTVQQHNEPASGQDVFHLHVHIMPRQMGVALLRPVSRKEDPKVLEEHAAKLIAALG